VHATRRTGGRARAYSTVVAARTRRTSGRPTTATVLRPRQPGQPVLQDRSHLVDLCVSQRHNSICDVVYGCLPRDLRSAVFRASREPSCITKEKAHACDQSRVSQAADHWRYLASITRGGGGCTAHFLSQTRCRHTAAEVKISRCDCARSRSTCCVSRSPPPFPRPPPRALFSAPCHRLGAGCVLASCQTLRAATRPPSRSPVPLEGATAAERRHQRTRLGLPRGGRRPHPTSNGPPVAGWAPRATQWTGADRPQLPRPRRVVKHAGCGAAAALAPAAAAAVTPSARRGSRRARGAATHGGGRRGDGGGSLPARQGWHARHY